MPKTCKPTKLGRNPFEGHQVQKTRTLPSLETQTKTKAKPIFEKVQELQIQVDWKELCKAALGRIF